MEGKIKVRPTIHFHSFSISPMCINKDQSSNVGQDDSVCQIQTQFKETNVKNTLDLEMQMAKEVNFQKAYHGLLPAALHKC